MLKKPSLDTLHRIARQHHMDMTTEDLYSFQWLMEGTLQSYERVSQMVEPRLPVKYERTPGYRPSAQENRFNAWYWKASVKGAADGKLSGKKIVLKDNVSLAGVPMMNGSSVLEGFVPDIDATIVTRMLDEGAEIVGKAVSEHLSFSGGSHTADTWPVPNPYDLTRSAGGSSSGSAVLVATREVDMAIGGDQGDRFGSRVPGAVFLALNQPLVWSPTPEFSRLTTPSITQVRWPAPWKTLRSCSKCWRVQMDLTLVRRWDCMRNRIVSS